MTTQEENALFDKFYKDCNGKKIERVDPNAYAQCFDLAIYWCEYLGLPKTIFSGLYGAHEIFDNWSNPAFTKIANSRTFVPIKGDICVWSGNLNGGIGHVAIATGEGDTNRFVSFDQNWSAGAPAQRVNHDYGYFLGVQRFKITNSPSNGGTGGNVSDIDHKAKGQVDLSLNAMKEAGEIDDNASEHWLLEASNPDKFSGKIKSILADLKSNRTRASIDDKTVGYLFSLKLLPTDDSTKVSYEQIKAVIDKLRAGNVDVAAIRAQAKKEQKDADIADLQDDSR